MEEIKLLNEQKEKFESENKILEIKNKNLNEQIIKLQNEILSNTREDNMNEHLKESIEIHKRNTEAYNAEVERLKRELEIIG